LLLLPDGAPPSTEIWPWSNFGNLCVWVRDRENAPAIAFDVADGLKSLFALLEGHAVQWPFLPLRIPEVMAKRERVKAADLKRGVPMHMPYGRSYFYELMLPRTEINRTIRVSEVALARLFFYLPVVFKAPPLFDAIHFFENALSEYTFLGDDITYVLLNPQLGPRSAVERIRSEDAILNSFRCVEALVGEPGNKTRFEARLRAAGIDPDERIGFRGQPQIAIRDKMRWLQELRDATCAHGKRRRLAPPTFLEVMEAQQLAGEIAYSALIEHASTNGRPEGSKEERRYLLSRIHGRKMLKLARDKLGGAVPEELVSSPSGFLRLEQALSEVSSQVAAQSVN
jgi:hypothetical protein